MSTSPSSKVAGLLMASIVAWALTTLFDIGPIILGAAGERIMGFENLTPMDPVQLRNIVTLYAFFGLPVAVVFVPLVGYPIWKRAERHGQTTLRNALWAGGLVGLILGFALAAYIFIYGLQTMANPNASFDSWTYGYQTMDDGMPTVLGWSFQLMDVVFTGVTGALAGLAAWTVAATMNRRRNPE
ncbi:MAG: hypothetical protein B7Y86_13130 [Brevundimonas subvibrioides]|uniref:Uncharacterized protein n=1 Tax=Brevundimonas subvibrioides TaxID=74313 RepID=A0A258HGW5_9CAUL|nr:hypothetical protein [Brevundimonas subvibrioides]OYX55593.1 MAG: hypothetical protein B7Y86_13130 [Brevundimonas subvibrioides]